jgi:uncharacterized protein (TIGR03437 family)
MPQGSAVHVSGTGFNAETTVVIEGAGVASTQLVSANQIDLLLGGPAEMTGLHLVLTNPGERLDYYVAPPSAPTDPASLAYPPPMRVLPPMATYADVQWDFYFGNLTNTWVALLNPTPDPVTVSYSGIPGNPDTRVTIPPGALYFYGPLWYYMTATAPIRMVEYERSLTLVGPEPEFMRLPRALTSVPPTLAAVVNGASFTPVALAPGELISIFGMGIGGAPTTFTLDVRGNLPTSISGKQVLINGKAAPLLYVSANQINAIVPYEVGTSGTATIQVVSNGLQSASWGVPAAPSAPAIFAVDSSGVGQAAVLNQDNSLNGASNPAGAGSVVQIFATGGGQTVPASVTGTLAGNSLDTTALPVTVTIGGADAPVMYHGSAPGEVAGLLQVNAVVPTGITPGPAVPIIVTAGGKQSQGGVTIAVQ